MLRTLNVSLVIAALSLAGCGKGGGPASAGGPEATPPSGSLGLAGGNGVDSTGNTFDHNDDGQPDPFAVLQRIQNEGPPEVSTKMHSCQKMEYATLGNILKQLGVNMAATGATSAAQLYLKGGQAMGAPNYGARVAEAISLSTAGATKLFDIFVAAAPEIIAAMPMVAQKGGAPVQMFDANGQCTSDGIAFVTGAPASQAQVDLCNNVLVAASSAQIGQTLAVATLLAAAHTCD